MSTILVENYVRRVHQDMCPIFRAALQSNGEDERDMGMETDGRHLAESLLRDAWRERATDIHIDPHARAFGVRFRVDGAVIDCGVVSPQQGHRLVNQFKTLADLNPIAGFTPQAARWTQMLDQHELDLRITTAPCLSGEKLAIRVLDPIRVEQRIDELGMSEHHRDSIYRWLSNLSGMFLVTGPTGSGKTTTLYALLHELRKQDRCVITIEDPVEYQVDGIAQMQVDLRHGLTFAEGLKTMLRLDPDYLMLGEVRDAQTARVAVDASVSGRVLMSSLHSRDAVSAVTAMRNWGLSHHEISVALSVVLAQRLVRKLCVHCRALEEPNELQIHWLQALGLPVPQQTWHAVGCEQCQHLGYYGRTGVFEVWHLDEQDYEMILRGDDEHAIRRELHQLGHHWLLKDGLAKVEAGTTTLSELQTMGEFVPPPASKGH